jgi:hypothetical protein
MTRLKKFMIAVRLALLAHQVKTVENRQRSSLVNMLYASDCRMHAAIEFNRQTTENDNRKRRLLAKIEELSGDIKS